MTRGRKREAFEHHFEGREVLQGLLELASSALDVSAVAERMRSGLAAGEGPPAVLPTLFEGEEPHFPDPQVAQRLFQNLLGLWDLLAEGKPWDTAASPRVRPPKKPKVARPAPFGPEGPDDAYVEAAWRYLEDLEGRERDRLLDSFENRQDALLGFLDEQGLTNDGYGVARHLLFELHAMIELGWPRGLRSVSLGELESGGSVQDPPAALRGYSDEALFEAEQDEESPLSPEELARVRDMVKRGLSALWGARKGDS